MAIVPTPRTSSRANAVGMESPPMAIVPTPRTSFRVNAVDVESLLMAIVPTPRTSFRANAVGVESLLMAVGRRETVLMISQYNLVIEHFEIPQSLCSFWNDGEEGRERQRLSSKEGGSLLNATV